MGGSHWSDDFYRDREDARVKSGTSAFAYDATVRTDPKAKKAAHPKMNPCGKTRESRDCDAHPNSVAIGVVFDVTGSMGHIPVELQKKLPQLMGLLLRKGYVQDPQILFGAVGDSSSDRVPLQIGQFESGIEMDDDLGRLYLEGGGGGTYEESYELPLYFFARHTKIDCFEKRKKKGFLFIVGDEMPYATLEPAACKRIVGDELPRALAIEEIIREARERYHVFFVIPHGASHGGDPKLRKRWEELLGPQNVIMLPDADGVCDAIGLAIGLCEGTANGDDLEGDLEAAGATHATALAVAKALDPLAKKSALARVATGIAPAAKSKASHAERL